MKNSRAILLAAAYVAILTAVLVPGVRGRPALADASSAGVALPSAIHEPTFTEARSLPPTVLDVEVLDALRYWTGQPDDVLRPWARAIAEASSSRAEAIWVASQASVESRFVGYVLDFHCNWPAWFHDFPPGACDSHWAVGPWQMHDIKMLDASPEQQAARAVQWMRARPQAWTTWRAARAQADAWLESR